MPNKLISEASAKESLDTTDMIPVAKSGEATAYHVTGQTLFDSIPTASSSQEGIVEIATKIEINTGEGGKIVGASNLSNCLAGTHYMYLSSSPPVASTITNRFTIVFDRAPAIGDLVTMKDSSGDYFILVYDSENTGWRGLNATDAAFVSFT